MLVASPTRYVPVAPNMIVLQGKDDMFYYLHRSLYDQCVILRDQYSRLLPSLYKLLGIEDTPPAICSTFAVAVPEPLDILGPFLSLIEKCEELEGIEECCGAISAMSLSVDFRKMFKVPQQVRASIKFSLNVREEYRMAWDRFFVETPTYESVLEAHKAPRGFSENLTEQGTEDYDDEELSEEDMEAALAELDAITGNIPAEEEADAPSEEPGDGPVTKSGFDRIRGL